MKQSSGGASPTITVHVPIKLSVRGGRKAIISSLVTAPPQQRTSIAMLKALARAHRWRQQIEHGEFASITELAKAQGVNESYACRLLRLTLLAPEIVTSILDGRQDADLTLKQLARPMPIRWGEQLAAIKTTD